MGLYQKRRRRLANHKHQMTPLHNRKKFNRVEERNNRSAGKKRLWLSLGYRRPKGDRTLQKSLI